MSTVFSDLRTGRRNAGWVFYDAQCSFCAALARWLAPHLLRRGFHCSPLQDRWVALALGIPRGELAKEFRVWTRKRELLSGADAIVFLAGRMWWAWPIYALAKLPGLRRATRAAYRSFAARRHCLSAIGEVHRRRCAIGSP